jgi:PAS domain S-box-containing protein
VFAFVIKQSHNITTLARRHSAPARLHVAPAQSSTTHSDSLSERTIDPTESADENTILVVNNAPELLASMSRLLRSSGYHVVTAVDGQDAFAVAQAQPPRLIISDVAMPRMDGIELCRLVRAHPALSQMPVLLVSAERKDNESVLAGLQAGADDYLEAPYEPVQLLAKVARLLARRQTEEALRKRAEEKLKQSEGQLAEAQQLAHVGSWNWDIKSNSVIWSDELYRIFGLEPQSVPASLETYLARVHPEDQAFIKHAIEQTPKSKSPLSLFYRIIRPDGEVRILHSHRHVVTDEAGNTVRTFGAVQDVTERKLAEEQLKSSNEKLRALAARLQSVREDESLRIARAIHDELGGALTALKIDLSWLNKRLTEPGTEALKQKLKSMSELIDETIQQVRSISTELRPAILDDLGLAAAIEWQTNEFQRRTEIECRIIALQEDVALSAEKATAVFRIFQEILTNVARHAHAKHIEISMTKRNGELVLQVADNGRGIKEDETTASTSLGLLGMRERALVFGGRVEVAGSKGAGTTVTVSIPHE